MSEQDTCERVTVRLPPALEDKVDMLVGQGRYMNRSAAIRDAVRQL